MLARELEARRSDPPNNHQKGGLEGPDDQCWRKVLRSGGVQDLTEERGAQTCGFSDPVFGWCCLNHTGLHVVNLELQPMRFHDPSLIGDLISPRVRIFADDVDEIATDHLVVIKIRITNLRASGVRFEEAREG